MSIRKLTENDYQNYIDLIKDFRNTNFTEEQFKLVLNLSHYNSDIWVIELDNKLISSATIIYETKFIHNICKAAHIEDVCTKKEFRGYGYGKKLMEHLISEAIKNDCYKINLVCAKDTSYFYKTSGFEDTGIHMSYLIKR
jgi:ribosomal protein S18 acetylase RimI-like enzyme